MADRPQKNHFRRNARVWRPRRLVSCADYRCSHSVATSADRWPDDVRLSDIEPQFVCQACGKRGADVRPDFNMHWRCCQRGTVDSRLSRSLTHCEEFA